MNDQDEARTSQVAQVLNNMNQQQRDELMGRLSELAPDLAAAIREALFTFNDLVYISDRGIQKLLREVDRIDLTRALKRAQDEVKDKILNNLSRRAGQMLIEEVDALGPTRLSEVKEAQANIARLALSLHDSGELTIVRPGSDDPLV